MDIEARSGCRLMMNIVGTYWCTTAVVYFLFLGWRVGVVSNRRK